MTVASKHRDDTPRGQLASPMAVASRVAAPSVDLRLRLSPDPTDLHSSRALARAAPGSSTKRQRPACSRPPTSELHQPGPGLRSAAQTGRNARHAGWLPVFYSLTICGRRAAVSDLAAQAWTPEQARRSTLSPGRRPIPPGSRPHRGRPELSRHRIGALLVRRHHHRPDQKGLSRNDPARLVP